MATLAWTAESNFRNRYLDTLVGGNYKWDWQSGQITYSLADAGLSISGLQSLAWTDTERAMFRSVFDSYEAVCGLRFVEVDARTPANLVEWKVAQVGGRALANHDVPRPAQDGAALSANGRYSAAADAWSDTPGSAGYAVVIHELGHALNLGHPHDGGWGSDRSVFAGSWNQAIWTAMSYSHGWSGARAPFLADYGHILTPMAFDVAALQLMYGANMSWRTGSDTYQLPVANGVGTGWSCIWDAGGIDTISNAGATRDCTINLIAATLSGANAGGAVSWVRGVSGGFTIAQGAVIENAVGGAGNDSLVGNAANNNLQGGAGRDSLNGGQGNDTMTGGAGNDVLDGAEGNELFLQDIAGNDTVRGGAGVDSVDYSGVTAAEASLLVNLQTGRVHKYQGGVLAGTDILSGIEAIVGSRSADTINGSVRAESLSGGGANDSLHGNAGNDSLQGDDGDDLLFGDAGNDSVHGGTGNDILSGNAGKNILNGGAGDDVLRDDGGSNTYVFDAQFGRDVLTNSRRTFSVADLDIAVFNDVDAGSLMFQRAGSNLHITVAGTSDSLRITEWFGATHKPRPAALLQIDQFRVGDSVLQGSVVDELLTLVGAAPVSMTSLMAA